MSKIVSNSILKIQKKILERIKKEPVFRHIVGAEREIRVDHALESLKQQGKIRGFVKTSKLDVSDLNGTDFFIIIVGRSQYKVLCMGVTGKKWIEKDKMNHPDKLELGLDLCDSDEHIQNMILELICDFREQSTN
ncbi:MAG: hypothetical protein AAB503_02580 [Patescibacteria group bacterium]